MYIDACIVYIQDLDRAVEWDLLSWVAVEKKFYDLTWKD